MSEQGKPKIRYVHANRLAENRRIDALCMQVNELNVEVGELWLCLRALESRKCR